MNEPKFVMPLCDVPIFKFNMTVNLSKVTIMNLKMVYRDVANILFNPLVHLKIDGTDEQLELGGFNGHIAQGRGTFSYQYTFTEQQIDLEEEVEIEIRTNCNYPMVEDESWFEINVIDNE